MRPGPWYSRSEGGTTANAAEALMLPMRSGPRANATEASVVPKWRRPPQPCGRGLGDPKHKEARTPIQWDT